MGYRSIEIRQDEYPGVTSVPNEFIDRFMAQAPGEYVKIYLYLLRCLYDREGCFSFAHAAQLFDSTEGDVRRALLFWEDMGLLSLDCSGDAITGISLCNAAARGCSGTQTLSAADADSVPDYSAAKIRAFCADEEIGQVVFVSGRYLGHRLQHRELCCLYYWYTELDFSPDLIIDLVDLCVSDGCTDIDALHHCALEWHAAQVHTAADARAYMKQRRTRRMQEEAEAALSEKVCAALGITGRSLSETELARLRRWTGEWDFSEELICEACRRTVTNTHQASFDYAETVLRNWHKDGIADMNGVRAQDEAYHARRRAAGTRTGSKDAGAAAVSSAGRRGKYGELELLTMANI